MRYLIDPKHYEEMLQRTDHTPDCFVRPGEYLHHLYLDGVKYTVAQAILECLKEAQGKEDREATDHLLLHQKQLDALLKDAQKQGQLGLTPVLGDPPPQEEEKQFKNRFTPETPRTVEDT